MKVGDMVKIEVPNDMPSGFSTGLIGMIMEQPDLEEDKYIVSLYGRLRLIDGDKMKVIKPAYHDCPDNVDCDENEE
jgi:hypothetical protein